MSVKIHIFAVAVEKYLSPKITPVPYAENDAKKVVMTWQELGVASDDCITLLSAEATQASIRLHLKIFLNVVQKGDTVVIFFAGHGMAFNGDSYITAHDTFLEDPKNTSIPLAEILDAVRKSPSERAILFIDSCHSGLPIDPGMRSIVSVFSDEEMKQFCEDSEFHVCFASCQVDESSWSHPALQHGIWSYCVIEALSGKAKKALVSGKFLTSDSLRDYLAAEVPSLLRKTHSGNKTQTPCLFGNFSKMFIIADLTALMAQRVAQASGVGTLLTESSLSGKESGRVCSLSGFQKKMGHKEPDWHNSTTEKFVRRLGASEVGDRGSKIHELLRTEFNYTRADFVCAESDGSVTIKTPDFDVNIWIQQDTLEASSYQIVTEVAEFRNPNVVGEERFDRVFSKFCDSVVIKFSNSFPVPETIDEIEMIPKFASQIKFDKSASWFELKLTNPSIKICVSDSQMTLTRVFPGSIKQLIIDTRLALTELSGSGITLMLPEKPCHE